MLTVGDIYDIERMTKIIQNDENRSKWNWKSYGKKQKNQNQEKDMHE